ncbi:hypothetical protein GCM10022224_094420 [Nonomuraea antimicrobica]|uniref:Right handed beta helix region n=1 Tax=Nonomuraea antimicrobica TaxID=561173 RepID=A0ABP7E3T8_9ACTN
MPAVPVSRRRMLGYAGAGATGALLPTATATRAAAADGAVLQVPSAAQVAGQDIAAQYVALRTDGYATPGDGGGATYRRLSAAPATPDRWHLRSNDGAWWEIADDVVSVRALGAKGDYDESTSTGADDTEALHAAARLDRVIYVPGTSRTYRCTRQISLTRDGTTWYGDGYRSKITLFSGEGGAGALIGIHGEPPTDPGQTSGPEAAPSRVVRGVHVSGLHLDTREKANDNGLGGSFVRDVWVENMYFSRIGRKALTFQYHCHNVHCRDVTIYASATEPGSTHAAISVEGQTEGLRYRNGAPPAVDLEGADMSNLTFTNIDCVMSGYNYIVVSNAHRVRFDNINCGDAKGAGAFVNFIRRVRDSHVRGIRGGTTARRLIFFDAGVSDCAVEDFHFGHTTGPAADGRAIQCAGWRNRLSGGSFGHRNAHSPEAILITGTDITLTGVAVRECAAALVLNAAPDATRLSLTDCRFIAATAPAFRIRGPGAIVQGNHFDMPNAPYVGRFEGPSGQCVGNHLTGGTGQRLVVADGATALISLNTTGAG